MGECGGVHHDGRLLIGGLMHPADHLGLVIALADLHVKPEFRTPLRAQLAQGLKILLAVHVGLSHAKTTEIRSIDDYYFSHVQTPLLLLLNAAERLFDGIRGWILKMNRMPNPVKHHKTKFVAAGLLVSMH